MAFLWLLALEGDISAYYTGASSVQVTLWKLGCARLVSVKGKISIFHCCTHTHTHTSDCHTHTQEELITINWSVSTKPWAKFYRHGFWKKIFEWILKQLWYISFWSFVFSTRQLTRLHWRFLPTSKLCLETLGIPSPARSCTDVTALLSGLMFRALLLLQSVQK